MRIDVSNYTSEIDDLKSREKQYIIELDELRSELESLRDDNERLTHQEVKL